MSNIDRLATESLPLGIKVGIDLTKPDDVFREGYTVNDNMCVTKRMPVVPFCFEEQDSWRIRGRIPQWHRIAPEIA